MKASTAEYKCVAIGPGGRHCSCCAPVSKVLKRLEHRKVRRNEKKYVENNLNENLNDHGYEQLEYEREMNLLHQGYE